MKTITILGLGLTCLLATGLGACADVQVHSASLPGASFATYRTFSFGLPEATPDGYEPSARSVEVKRRLQPIITAALEQKGYVLSPDQHGDMIVKYASGAREREIVKSARMADAAGVAEDDDFVEGSVVVDLFDASTHGQIFHGSARARVNPDKIDEERLRGAVRDVLEKLPMERVAPISAQSTGSLTP